MTGLEREGSKMAKFDATARYRAALAELREAERAAARLSESMEQAAFLLHGADVCDDGWEGDADGGPTVEPEVEWAAEAFLRLEEARARADLEWRRLPERSRRALPHPSAAPRRHGG
jgi:hypothetical protein